MTKDKSTQTRIVGAVPQRGEDSKATAKAFAKVNQKVSAFTAKAATERRPARSA